MEKLPQVVKEGILKVTDDLTVKVYILDNGDKVIEEKDTRKILDFLGSGEDFMGFLERLNKEEVV